MCRRCRIVQESLDWKRKKNKKKFKIYFLLHLGTINTFGTINITYRSSIKRAICSLSSDEFRSIRSVVSSAFIIAGRKLFVVL